MLKLKKATNEKLISLAKENGFSFTSEELNDYRKDLYENLNKEDLASVSGGVQPKITALLFLLALGSTENSFPVEARNLRSVQNTFSNEKLNLRQVKNKIDQIFFDECSNNQTKSANELFQQIITRVNTEVKSNNETEVTTEGNFGFIKNKITGDVKILNIKNKIEEYLDATKRLNLAKKAIFDIFEEECIPFRGAKNVSEEYIYHNAIERVKKEFNFFKQNLTLFEFEDYICIKDTKGLSVWNVSINKNDLLNSLKRNPKAIVPYISYNNLMIKTATNQANFLLKQIAGVNHFYEVKKEDRPAFKSNLKDLVNQIAEKTEKGNIPVLKKGLAFFNGKENLIIVSNMGREQTRVSSEDLHKIIRLYRESLAF